MNGIKYLRDIQCCIKQCKSTPLKNPEKTFFPFPDPDLYPVKVENADGNQKELDLRSMWITLCSIQPNEAVDAVICSKHFRNQDFHSVLTNGCMIPKLRSEAIPSIFLNQPVDIKKEIREPVVQDNVNSAMFSCHLCNSHFKSNSGLSIHMTVHDNRPKRYKCRKCNFKTKAIGEIRKHIRKNHSSKNNIGNKNQCPNCEYWSLNVDEFKTHMTQHEKKPLPEIPQLKTPQPKSKSKSKSEPVKTPQPKSKSKSKSKSEPVKTLQPKSKSKSKSEPVKTPQPKSKSKSEPDRICNFCNYSAINLKDFNEHLLNHMAEVTNPPEKIFYYMCVMCDFGSDELEKYKIHLSEHTFLD